MKGLRIFLYAVLALLVLVAGTLAAGYAWVQIEAGRAWLAATLERAARGPGQTVEIGRIEGRVPFRMTVSEVTVADEAGVWLTVERAALDWDPIALLRGVLRIEGVAADRITVARRPVDAPAPEREPEPEPTGPPRLPELPFAVDLRHLVVYELVLEPPVLEGDTRATLRVAGAARLGVAGSGIEADLAVARIDDQPGTAQLVVSYAPATERLILDVRLSEPAGGVIAQVLDLPGRPPVEATLAGSGTLADWQARLSAEAGSVASLSATATIRERADGYALALDGEGDVAALLGPSLAPLVGERATLAVQALLAPGPRITFNSALLDLAAGRLHLSGSASLAEQRLHLNVTAEAGPESPLQALLPEAGWQRAELAGCLEGPLLAPVLEATLTLAQPYRAGLRTERATLAVTAEPVVPVTAPDLGVLVAAQAELAGLSGLDPQLAPLVGPELSAAAEAQVDVATATVRLEVLDIALAGGTVSASGTLHDWGGAITGTALADLNDLSRLSGLAGMPLEGAASISAELDLGGGGALQADVSGTAQALGLGVPAADALLGPELRFGARVRQGPEGELTVSGMRLESPHITAQGTARLAQGRLQADLGAELPDLAVLADPLDVPLTGAASVTASATGPLDDLKVETVAAAPRLAVAGQAFRDVRVNATANALPAAPRGVVRAQARHGAHPLTAQTGFVLDGDRLALTDLAVSIGDSRVAGAIAVALDSLTATGRLDGTLPDLAVLSELADVELGGAAELGATLRAAEGRQAADLTLAARNLRVNDGEGDLLVADRLDLTAELRDLLGTPAGTARLEGQALTAGGIDVDTLTATAQDRLDQADFTLAAAADGFDAGIELAGTYQHTDARQQVRLAQATGHLADETFRLVQPAQLAFGDGTLAIEDVILAAREARLALSVTLGERALSGRLALNDVPLELARLLDPTLEIEGRLNGEGTLAGTPADPRLDLALQVADLRVPQATEAGFQAINGEVQVDLTDRLLAVEAEARTARPGIDLALRLAAPVETGPGLAVAMAPAAPLDGALAGTVDLARFNDLLAVSGDRVRGRLDVDLGLEGTLAEPALTGTVLLAEGRYENQATGAVITDIAARIVGAGRTLRIAQFEGRTPNGGTVALSGSAELDPEALQALDLAIVARDARLLQIDLVTATLDADLTLQGSFEEARLQGRTQVRRAEIRVPDRLPPGVVSLDVIEVNGDPDPAARQVPVPRRKPAPGAPASAAAPPQEANAGFVLALDVAVAAPNQIFVRGRGVDAELGGELHLAGTAEEPVVTGTLDLLQGKLDLLGKRFAFTRGQITFVGDGSLEPALDLVAETRLGEGTAQIAVTGRVTAPSIDVSSTPELPKDEILARVLFDKPIGQLSTVEALTLAQSAATLAGIGGGPGLLDRVRSTLGLDRLEITGGENGGTGAPGIAAGRYLSEDVYVGVEQGAGQQGSRAKVEVELTDNIQIEADIGTDADNKVGIQFQWDY